MTTTRQAKESTMSKQELKLFVWEDVLTDWSSGIIFALAPDVDTARRLAAIKYMEEGGEYYKKFPLEDTVVWKQTSKPPLVITEPEGFYVWGGG